jgi:hypothetical protein
MFSKFSDGLLMESDSFEGFSIHDWTFFKFSSNDKDNGIFIIILAMRWVNTLEILSK